MTINLTGDKNVKTFTDFWQKMIDEDLIDTKTVGWTDDWNKGLDDGSIASLLTGAWMPYNLLSGAPNGDGKWRIAQMPTADGSETNSENGGSSLAIVKSDDKAKVAAAYKFMEYACHDAEGIKTRVDGGAFPADNDTLKSNDFLNMTSLTDSDGKAHEYFGGQKFNEELAKAAANVSTGYKFLPFEVYARGKFGDYAGDAYTGKTTLSDAVASWQKDLKDYAKQQGYQVKYGNHSRLPPVVSVAGGCDNRIGHSSERPIFLCHGSSGARIAIPRWRVAEECVYKRCYRNHSYKVAKQSRFVTTEP